MSHPRAKGSSQSIDLNAVYGIEDLPLLDDDRAQLRSRVMVCCCGTAGLSFADPEEWQHAFIRQPWRTTATIAIILMSASDYTIVLPPNANTLFNAGKYNPSSDHPKYTINVKVPTHVENQIDLEQYLTGTGGNYRWIWCIKNRSIWPAFITVTADGILVRGDVVDS
jgi:hypothetical protein